MPVHEPAPADEPGPVPAPGSLSVPAGVQVWWAQVDVGRLSDRLRADLAADLDGAAARKVARFVRAQDRDRGLAAHALLRRLLAAVVGGAPSELVLSLHCVVCGTSEHGKPYLDLAGGRPAPVELNLSHSGSVVAVALAPAGTAVGVDVEAHRGVEWPSLRRAVFADAEWERTEAAADPDGSRFDAWARKESSVKASGHGLSIPLRDVLISDDPSAAGDSSRPAMARAPGDSTASDSTAGAWTAQLPAGAGSTAGWDLGLRHDVAGAVATLARDGRPQPLLEPPVVRLVTIG